MNAHEAIREHRLSIVPYTRLSRWERFVETVTDRIRFGREVRNEWVDRVWVRPGLDGS